MVRPGCGGRRRSNSPSPKNAQLPKNYPPPGRHEYRAADTLPFLLQRVGLLRQVNHRPLDSPKRFKSPERSQPKRKSANDQVSNLQGIQQNRFNEFRTRETAKRSLNEYSKQHPLLRNIKQTIFPSGMIRGGAAASKYSRAAARKR